MTADRSTHSLSVVILAAGAGKRMKSNLPKPLHPVGGRPMLAHVLAVTRPLEPVDFTVVGSSELARLVASEPWAAGVQVAIQDPPLGTADAVRVALESSAVGSTVLVLYADHPLVTTTILTGLIARFDLAHSQLALMTCMVDDAAGYGRIVRDGEGRISAVVEPVDDFPDRRSGRTEINSGVVAFDRDWGKIALSRVQLHPAKKEYFLTALAELTYESNPESIISVEGPADLLVGINDRAELAVADSILRDRYRQRLMKAGVTLIAPETNLIDLDVEIGQDTTLGPNCVVERGTRIGEGCRIGPNAVLRVSSIGDRVRVESSTIEQSSVGDDSDVGPYAHIRSGSTVGQQVHIGNYAELKNANIGDRVRIGHFSYIGDASLGPDVNIGAGSITCNFDGADKHRTEIGPGAFIGSDTMLIAPVTVGAGARTGAGSVVTRDVADGATVVGMPARQVRQNPPQRAGASEGGTE